MMTGAVLILRGIAVAACREKTGEKSAGYETGNWQSLDLRQFLCRGGTDSVKRAAGGTLGSARARLSGGGTAGETAAVAGTEFRLERV